MTEIVKSVFSSDNEDGGHDTAALKLSTLSHISVIVKYMQIHNNLAGIKFTRHFSNDFPFPLCLAV